MERRGDREINVSCNDVEFPSSWSEDDKFYDTVWILALRANSESVRERGCLTKVLYVHHKTSSQTSRENFLSHPPKTFQKCFCRGFVVVPLQFPARSFKTSKHFTIKHTHRLIDPNECNLSRLLLQSKRNCTISQINPLDTTESMLLACV